MIFSKGTEQVSGWSHAFGALLGVAALVILLVWGHDLGPYAVVGFSIYGASLILLYGASAVYHLLEISPRVKEILRKIDHMMIFVLIAGTYTPICLVALRNYGGWGWTLLSIVWALAIAGIITNAVYFKAPRWLYTTLYVLMGWVALVAIVPLWDALSATGLAWLFGGGVIYSIGAALYATKWPGRDRKWFGFHEVFHLFCIGGSVCHFFLMLTLL